MIDLNLIWICCEGCQHHGQQVAEGEQVTSVDDPCVQCQCRQGGLVCSKKACPVLTCPPSKAVLKPGSCCPECQGSFPSFPFFCQCSSALCPVPVSRTSRYVIRYVRLFPNSIQFRSVRFSLVWSSLVRLGSVWFSLVQLSLAQFGSID